MSDDIQVIDYSNSPAGSRSSPVSTLARASNKSPASVINKPATPGFVGQQTIPSATDTSLAHQQSKYAALLTVIEELGRDIRPTYAGNKLAAERLKRGIVHARVLTRECMTEVDKISRGAN